MNKESQNRNTDSSTAHRSLQPGRILRRKCACGGSSASGECEECKKKELQRKAASAAGPAIAPPVVHQVLSSPGRPLETHTRSIFEPRFAHDFSRVRVHADDQAAQSAQAVDALAYTVGEHMVFGRGQYQPQVPQGQSLLAHELTHVMQQGSLPARNADRFLIDPHTHQEAEAEANAASVASAGFSSPRTTGSQPSLQRAPRGAPAPAAPHITQIVVDQNSKQRVTATFSDGHSESDECSTGKGHCCFDPASGSADGGACSPSRSNQVGNNCTPIGDFVVTHKILDNSGINFWTQFHDAKSVALHEYRPVSGEPLSHGCVRLHTNMARTIFDGSVSADSAPPGKATKVQVKNLAKPKCEDADVQKEWQKDFKTAGTTPPDGQTIDPNLNRRLTPKEIKERTTNIRETREELRSALGVSDRDLTAKLAAGSPDIPHCVPTRTIEEQETTSATTAGIVGTAATTQTTGLKKALQGARNTAAAERVVGQAGERLWRDSTQSARAGGSGTDDRQLYWTRLEMTMVIREWDPSWTPNADSLRRLHEDLLQLFERSSRGMTTASFAAGTSTSGARAPADPNLKRILVSGFDPFGFPAGGDIRQSNISGAAALALDGDTLTEGGVSARVESVVYPVRYADFNAGMVENFLRPQLSGPFPPHFVVSISQGQSKFELEEWAGRRRSVSTFADNLGQMGGGTTTKPTEPPGIGAGPEFLHTSVPQPALTSMRQAVGRSSAIPEETTVKDLPSGATTPRTLPGGPGPSPGAAVEGSGGGFLSNEIFYRNSLVRTSLGSNVPMVHLHTPILPPGATDAVRNALIDTIRKILRAALPNL